MPSEYHELIIREAEIRLAFKFNLEVNSFSRKYFKDSLIRAGFKNIDFLDDVTFVPDSYHITKDEIIVIEVNSSTKTAENKSAKTNRLVHFWFALDAIYPDVILQCYFIDNLLSLNLVDLCTLYYANLTVGDFKKEKKLHTDTKRKILENI